MGSIISDLNSSSETTEMALKFITDAIASDKVVIFSKSYCPYCKMAKEVCTIFFFSFFF